TTSNGEDQHPAREQTIPKPKAAPEPYQHLGIILGRLPLDQRKVIELVYFGGMSQQDIASYLDLPLGTVNTRIRLGMQKLRGMYQRNP
ncbi:MAG: sigma factor-like helix-turn-helix DNA-binding protein, partial [Candidatus Methylomirabilales bacterium]